MFRLNKKISFLYLIVLAVFVMLGNQNARCETSDKALEQRIENIESRLASTENVVEKTLSEFRIGQAGNRFRSFPHFRKSHRR